MSLAPIALFVYARPDHTRRTVEALLQNEGASDSDLIIFSDAAKTPEKQAAVDEVRSYLKKITGFKSVTLHIRTVNWGLAKSIIHGVTMVINEYGKTIVIEDDIVTSKAFLRFMNAALNTYANDKDVWHVSGWNYPIITDGLDDMFFWRIMNCWGWATWRDRWCHYEKEPKKIVNLFSKDQIYRFNVDGTENFWSQVLLNINGKLDTWAIFWYATIFLKNGLCLHPTSSLVQNIGHDGTGENCGADISLAQRNYTYSDHQLIFETQIIESATAIKSLKMYFIKNKKSIFRRGFSKIKRVFFL